MAAIHRENQIPENRENGDGRKGCWSVLESRQQEQGDKRMGQEEESQGQQEKWDHKYQRKIQREFKRPNEWEQAQEDDQNQEQEREQEQELEKEPGQEHLSELSSGAKSLGDCEGRIEGEWWPSATTVDVVGPFERCSV